MSDFSFSKIIFKKLSILKIVWRKFLKSKNSNVYSDQNKGQKSIVVSSFSYFLMQSWFMRESHYSSSCSCAFIGPATMNKCPIPTTEDAAGLLLQ